MHIYTLQEISRDESKMIPSNCLRRMEARTKEKKKRWEEVKKREMHQETYSYCATVTTLAIVQRFCIYYTAELELEARLHTKLD